MAESGIAPGDRGLERRLRQALEGEVRFDAFTRGLYSTDASHYQVEPLGVVFPRTVTDVEATLEVARESGAPVVPRGGGTSQCGQAIGRAIVMDTSRHLTGIASGSDPGAPDTVADARDRAEGLPMPLRPGSLRGVDGGAEVVVGPGVVLDHLNRHLRPHGLWFPVDPSTGSRATLGGMAGNNSAGARSIRYGMMVDNVSALEVVLPDGRRTWLGEGHRAASAVPAELAALRALFAREAGEIARRTPGTVRNVAGYNLDRLHPDRENLARLMVGSEGTLAFFSRLRLKLAPLPRRRVLGVCHFPDLVSALDAVQHLVTLGPSAVELVDESVLRLAAENDDYRAAMASFVKGEPGALLLVELASDEDAAGARLEERLDALDEMMGDLGHPGSVIRAVTRKEQDAVWSVRKAGLNIVMSMAGPRKPVSFIEDCAVPLENLAEYATSVDEIFRRHDTTGTWYAHASVGCLHVRPALNLKDPADVARVRRIAEETHEVVRRLGGTHSGEHGDGILRSEFLEAMLGSRMVRAYEEVKRTFDPRGLMNPGKIVDPPRMDDRSLFRYKPGYGERPLPVVLDWSATGGLLAAAEGCNNNGACRKYDPGVMCPSFRVTHDERHSTRGRANALRLALTGQLGEEGLDAPEMAEALSLCVSCKACKRECPAGVDMARMKLEWQHHRNRRLGVPLRERLLAGLPRVAPRVSAMAPLANVLRHLPGRGFLGLAPQRRLPRWSTRPWKDRELAGSVEAADVAVFVDTFSRWFEPEIPRAARSLLEAGARTAVALVAPAGERPLCCGRTWLSAGMLDEARVEASRLLAAALPLARAGLPIAGLEPSCLYTLKDEIPALLPGPDAELVAERACMLTEYLRDEAGGPFPVRTGHVAPPSRSVLVHGHCHQKAFGGADATTAVLSEVARLDVRVVDSSCCGMAGAFGYHAEHYATSMAMAELDLAPAIRAAGDDVLLVADGTSCRAQIADITGRRAESSLVVLARELAQRGA